MTAPGNEVEAFVASLADRHPELRRRVHWGAVRTMARREGIALRTVSLSHPARLVGLGGRWEIQMAEDLDPNARAFYGVHELVHFWRDREVESTFYSSDEWRRDPKEDFANVVAWYLTSTAHEFHARESSL